MLSTRFLLHNKAYVCFALKPKSAVHILCRLSTVYYVLYQQIDPQYTAPPLLLVVLLRLGMLRLGLTLAS